MNSATQTVTSARTTDSSRLAAGRAVISWAVAGGRTSSANTSSAPVIWLTSAAVAPSSSRNTVSSTRTGHAVGAGHVGVDRGEQQRPADHGQHGERDGGEHSQREHLGRR